MTHAEINALLDKWIAALRSGEYNQVRGLLKRKKWDGGYGHCCLGVLCEVAGLKQVPWRVDGLPASAFAYASDIPNSVGLPDEFRLDLGVSLNDEIRLTKMNDDQRCTFDEIADFIEENRNVMFDTGVYENVVA